MANKKNASKDTLIGEAELFEKSRSEKKALGAYRRIDPAKDPSYVYSIRIPASRLEALRRLAADQVLQPSVMIRQWVLERLEAEIHGPTEVTKMADEMMEAASRLRALGRRT